jgi:hypothetical protein
MPARARIAGKIHAGEVITVHPILMTAPVRGVTEPEGARMSKTDKTRPWWVQMADAPRELFRPAQLQCPDGARYKADTVRVVVS